MMFGASDSVTATYCRCQKSDKNIVYCRGAVHFRLPNPRSLPPIRHISSHLERRSDGGSGSYHPFGSGYDARFRHHWEVCHLHGSPSLLYAQGMEPHLQSTPWIEHSVIRLMTRRTSQAIFLEVVEVPNSHLCVPYGSGYGEEKPIRVCLWRYKTRPFRNIAKIC